MIIVNPTNPKKDESSRIKSKVKSGHIKPKESFTNVLNEKISFEFSEAIDELLNDLKEEEIRMESEYLKRIKEEEFEIGRLRKYGELISEYPDILKFLYIEKLSDKIEVIVLPQDEKTGFPVMLEHLEDSRVKDLLPEEPEPKAPEKSFVPEEQESEPDFAEEPEKEIKG